MRYDAVDANVTSATVGTPPTAIALPPAKPPSGNFLETAAPLTMAHIDNIALGGGIYGGWNYQITEDYVAGVEADFGWANETANLHGSLHRSCSTSESDWAVALASEQSLTALPVVIAHDKSSAPRSSSPRSPIAY